MSRNDSTVTAFWCGGGDEQVMRWDSPPSEVQRPTPEPESGEVTGDRGPFPVGCVLGGKYRIDRMLGAGTMASVFAATHVRNANRVAVKILHPAFENNLDVRARFLREGYAANSVRHAGTVRALDDDTTEDGATFMVMELLEGETLESLSERRGRRLPPSEVAGLMGQLLDILVAAHERGIVHRDIKPENLFVQSDGRLRILDFGVARVLEGSVTETRAGSVIGTLPYMAPEQILGKSREVEARSDVWSVGATAFTLVSGRFVHEAETPEEMMVFAGSRQARSLASVSPDVPDAFIQVVDRALRFEKGERWPDARSMQAAFASAAASPERLEENAPSNGGEPPPSPRTSLSESVVRPRESHRRAARGAAAIALAMASVVATVAASWRGEENARGPAVTETRAADLPLALEDGVVPSGASGWRRGAREETLVGGGRGAVRLERAHLVRVLERGDGKGVVWAIC